MTKQPKRRATKATADAADVMHQSTKIARSMLAGHDPEWQSAVLADLLSLWVAGHHPQLRQKVLAAHLELVRQLVPASEMQIFGPAGHPGHKAPLPEVPRP